jgi:hypothetical protein
VVSDVLGGDEDTLGNKPLYEFNEDETGTIRLCIGIVGKEQYKLETKTNSWKAFTWYHLVPLLMAPTSSFMSMGP